LAYLSAAVVLATATAELYDDLLLPDWTPRFVLVLLIIGLPIALVLAWAQELRPEEGSTPGIEESADSPMGTGSRLEDVSDPNHLNPGLRPVDPGLGSLHPDLPTTQPGPSPALSPGVSPEVSAESSPDVSAETFQRSIVVLPFDNLSPDPDQEYFCDGMTEEIISDLSGLRSLRVISRTSAMLLKGSGKDLRAIGRELSVRYVLEGSVRKAGDRLRVTAQLIDARDDAHLWSEKYDGKLGDVFEIQENVARAIVAALALKLSPREEAWIQEVPVTDVRAYEAYLRARHGTWEGTPEALERARQQMENGLEIAGPNALFYAGLGYVYFQMVNLGLAQEDLILRAEENAHRALELDPGSGEAHLVLGLVYQAFRGDQRASFWHFRKALERKPNDAEALLWLAVGDTLVGRIEEGRSLVQKALQVDPVNPVVQFGPVFVDLWDGRFDRPEEELTLWFRLEPNSPPALVFSALALCYAGREERSTALLDENLQPELPDVFTALGRLLQSSLQGNRAEEMSLPSQLENTVRRDAQLSYFLADLNAMGAQTQAALRWLETAAGRGFCNYPFVAKHDPMLANIRDEPDFQRIAARMKEEWQSFDA
jgi:non-specific serine/threonine protein kinase